MSTILQLTNIEKSYDLGIITERERDEAIDEVIKSHNEEVDKRQEPLTRAW